jgi:hypothetical protein
LSRGGLPLNAFQAFLLNLLGAMPAHAVLR